MPEKIETCTLNDVRQFFAESNAATIGSKDLVQDTFIFPPGREDKIEEILEKLRSPTNLLLWGTRGVGKTLFLKKTYFDLLDSKNKSILPIFIDLNKVYHLSDSLAKASSLSDADRIPLQNQLLERYYRVMIYRGVLECMRDRGLDNKVLDFLRSLFGNKETRKIDDIKSYLETEIIALGTPFSAQDLVKGKLTLSNSISYQDDVLNFLTNSYSEIFEKIYKTLEVKSFILIFDEFSMLPANLQDAMMSNVIQSLETKRQYTIYFKIAVMSGRYLIDTQTKDMYQHGFLPIKFEREYYDIFKGGTVDPDTAIDRYYEAVCLNRLRGMADRYLDFKGNPIKDGQQIVQLFTDPNGANCFKMLVNFAGYNFRRFFMFILNICNDKSKSNYFTEEMILRQSNSYYTELISKIKQNPELQQYSQCVDAFLNELVKSLPEDTLYFGLSDDQPFIIRTLEYFSIITQVTDKVKDRRKIPVYLLDLSTYVAIKEFGLKEMREKFAKGTLSIFRVGDIDKVIVFNTDDFKGIQMAYKIDDKFQELQHYYQDILDLEADLAAGEDKSYVAKSIQRILKKIDERYKEKYTKETLEKKLKSYDSRSETILEADKTLKQEAKKEEQIASVQATAAATAASEGYDKDVEFGKFSKLASMDARLLDELTKLKITYDQLKGYKGNAPKIEGLTNQLPWDVRPTLTKVMASI